MRITIKSLIMEFFMNHPNKEFETPIAGDWVREQYHKAHGKYPANVGTNVADLHRNGRLMRVRQGVYKYDPDHDHEGEYQDFPEGIKQAIFHKDDFKCVICGLGEQDGVKIAADHKIARSKGGTNTLENGQTLCYEHNSMKKDYSMTEAGKRFFIKLYEAAMKNDDTEMMAFCKSVFDVYDKHDVDRHITRPDHRPGSERTSR